MSTPNTYLSLNLFDLQKLYMIPYNNQYTITVWIKYFGQLSSSTSDCIILFRLTSDGTAYICYNPTTTLLYFYHNSNIAYTDATFNSFIGQWCLISFSSFLNNLDYIPGFSNYFGYLFTFYVHNKEVTKSSNYSIPSPGLTVSAFDFGYEFSALLTDFRIYTNFIVNPFGYVMGSKSQNYLSFSLPMSGNSASASILSDYNFNSSYYKNFTVPAGSTLYSILGINNQADYSPYFTSFHCDSSYFFDITKIKQKDPPCYACDSACADTCSYSSPAGCTCDFKTANNLLRIDSDTGRLYCETLAYNEFSKTTNVTLSNVKVVKSQEYTIEFWFYLYAYNETNIAFEGHEIIWDLHNYIKIANVNNTVVVSCSPLMDMKNYKLYSSYFRSYAYHIINKGVMNWIYVTCSTSIPRSIYYLDQHPEDILDKFLYPVPDLTQLNSTSLIIQPLANAKTNYGLLFLREIKLWSSYDIRRYTTKCK